MVASSYRMFLAICRHCHWMIRQLVILGALRWNNEHLWPWPVFGTINHWSQVVRDACRVVRHLQEKKMRSRLLCVWWIVIHQKEWIFRKLFITLYLHIIKWNFSWNFPWIGRTWRLLVSFWRTCVVKWKISRVGWTPTQDPVSVSRSGFGNPSTWHLMF